MDKTPIDSAARPIVERLGLAENPLGGWFRQVHAGPAVSGSRRPAVTVITYLLDAARPTARLHRMSADAVHFFHQGAPIAVVTIAPGGDVKGEVLGPDNPQIVVPGGTWKGFELLGGCRPRRAGGPC